MKAVQILGAVAASLSVCSAADVTIEWQSGMVQTATAQRGDTLNFVWSGMAPVQQVATLAEFEACDDSASLGKTGIRSPSVVVVPTTTPDGSTLYYINNYKDKCGTKGIKVAVTVSGGAGGDAGECVAVACRAITPQSDGVATLDHRCCSFYDSYGYKASCATGYTYYQWGQASANGAWDGETCDAPIGTGSCCVVDGGAVPKGATTPKAVVPASGGKAAEAEFGEDDLWPAVQSVLELAGLDATVLESFMTELQELDSGPILAAVNVGGTLDFAAVFKQPLVQQKVTDLGISAETVTSITDAATSYAHDSGEDDDGSATLVSSAAATAVAIAATLCQLILFW